MQPLYTTTNNPLRSVSLGKIAVENTKTTINTMTCYLVYIRQTLFESGKRGTINTLQNAKVGLGTTGGCHLAPVFLDYGR